MNDTTKTKLTLVVISLAAVVFMAGSARGEFLGFIPEPASPTTPEFIWDGTALFEGPGALGTGYMIPGPGDGELPPASQAAPGLTVNTPFLLPGIPGGVVGPADTTFYDASLDILGAGLPGAGPAAVIGGVVFQPLGPGAFEVWSTDPLTAPEEDQTLLLAGTVNSAVITGLLGEPTGATLSADVTYTAGAIVDAIGGPFDGSFSWTLLDIIPPLSVSAASGMLGEFQANGTGHFTPEPCTMVVLCLGGTLTLLRSRKK